MRVPRACTIGWAPRRIDERAVDDRSVGRMIIERKDDPMLLSSFADRYWERNDQTLALQTQLVLDLLTWR